MEGPNSSEAIQDEAAAADPTPETAKAPAALEAKDRSFVVQLSPDCGPGDPAFKGRVQHLSTSDGGNFGSVHGLVAIMRQTMERASGRQGK